MPIGLERNIGRSGYSGYSGRSGFSGTSGFSGKSGYSGYSGQFGGDTQYYVIDDAVGEVNNTDGRLAHNNSALNSSTTTLSIHQNNSNSTLVGSWISNMTLSTNAVGGRLKITSLSNPNNWILFNVTGTGVAGLLIDGYNYNVPVTYVAGTAISDLTAVAVSFTYSGNSGVSGYSGYSGSGVSGYSGKSGYSGYSGFSGYSGPSGYSGYSGSGVSGYSGYSGTSGYSGISGFSGLVADGYTTVVASADQDVNNVTVISTYLTFNVTSAAKPYGVTGVFYLSGDSAVTDMSFKMGVASGTMNGCGGSRAPGTSLTVQAGTLAAAGAQFTGVVNVGASGVLGQPCAVSFEFSFLASSSNTTFAIYFGNASGTSETTRMHAGSKIEYRLLS